MLSLALDCLLILLIKVKLKCCYLPQCFFCLASNTLHQISNCVVAGYQGEAIRYGQGDAMSIVSTYLDLLGNATAAIRIVGISGMIEIITGVANCSIYRTR